MKLKDYTNGIRECPDEEVKSEKASFAIPRLTSDFGVYDNYCIFVYSDLARMVFGLALEGLIPKESLSPGYIMKGSIIVDSGPRRYRFTDQENEVVLDVSFGDKYGVTGLTWDRTEELVRHQEFQEKNDNVTLMIHPNRKGSTQLQQARDGSNTVIRLTDYLKNNNFYFCLPQSNGWDHDGDLSRIVYYPNEVEAEMCRGGSR